MRHLILWMNVIILHWKGIMEEIEVNGFGKISLACLAVRSQGQSFSCGEKRASLTVENDEATDIVFVRLDGGYYPEGNSCDYSVSSQSNSPQGFLLELKGRHTEHAVTQLGNALKRLKADGVGVLYRAALVVSSGGGKIPSGDWQKLQKQFISMYKVLLKRYPNNARVLFSEIIA